MINPPCFSQASPSKGRMEVVVAARPVWREVCESRASPGLGWVSYCVVSPSSNLEPIKFEHRARLAGCSVQEKRRIKPALPSIHPPMPGGACQPLVRSLVAEGNERMNERTRGLAKIRGSENRPVGIALLALWRPRFFWWQAGQARQARPMGARRRAGERGVCTDAGGRL